jgi:hypothetical protein
MQASLHLPWHRSPRRRGNKVAARCGLLKQPIEFNVGIGSGAVRVDKGAQCVAADRINVKDGAVRHERAYCNV